MLLLYFLMFTPFMGIFVQVFDCHIQLLVGYRKNTSIYGQFYHLHLPHKLTYISIQGYFICLYFQLLPFLGLWSCAFVVVIGILCLYGRSLFLRFCIIYTVICIFLFQYFVTVRLCLCGTFFMFFYFFINSTYPIHSWDSVGVASYSIGGGIVG